MSIDRITKSYAKMNFFQFLGQPWYGCQMYAKTLKDLLQGFLKAKSFLFIFFCFFWLSSVQQVPKWVSKHPGSVWKLYLIVWCHFEHFNTKKHLFQKITPHYRELNSRFQKKLLIFSFFMLQIKSIVFSLIFNLWILTIMIISPNS